MTALQQVWRIGSEGKRGAVLRSSFSPWGAGGAGGGVTAWIHCSQAEAASVYPPFNPACCWLTWLTQMEQWNNTSPQNYSH